MFQKTLLSISLALSVNAFPNSDFETFVKENDKVGNLVNQELHAISADLSQLKFQKTTLRALNFLIARASEELRDKKLFSDAAYLENDWNNFQSQNLVSLDLGDHRPLSQWLSQKYNWLESKLGTRIMALSGLDDIKVFNFAIPVVYTPWNNAWSREEYKEHFVPYTAATIYWTARGSCGVALNFPASMLCAPAAKLARSLTTKTVAPIMSGVVYRVANP